MCGNDEIRSRAAVCMKGIFGVVATSGPSCKHFIVTVRTSPPCCMYTITMFCPAGGCMRDVRRARGEFNAVSWVGLLLPGDKVSVGTGG